MLRRVSNSRSGLSSFVLAAECFKCHESKRNFSIRLFKPAVLFRKLILTSLSFSFRFLSRSLVRFSPFSFSLFSTVQSDAIIFSLSGLTHVLTKETAAVVVPVDLGEGIEEEADRTTVSISLPPQPAPHFQLTFLIFPPFSECFKCHESESFVISFKVIRLVRS